MNASSSAHSHGSAPQPGNVVEFAARRPQERGSGRAGRPGSGVRAASEASPASGNGQQPARGLSSSLGLGAEYSPHEVSAAEAGDGLLTLSVEHHVEGVGHLTRLLSAATVLSIAELVEAILVVYRWPREPHAWIFRVKSRGEVSTYAPGRLGGTEQILGTRSSGTSVGAALGKGSVAQLHVGAYSFLIHVTDMVPHHSVDAHVVLLGAEFLPGMDAQGRTLSAAPAVHPVGIPTHVSLSEVNIDLAGQDTVEQVMAHVQPELKTLLHDGELYEFVPLLQALDLQRPANVSEHAAELLADVPVEESALGRAAAWARIIALSTLVDAHGVDEVSESFLQAVGYRCGDITGSDSACLAGGGGNPLVRSGGCPVVQHGVRHDGQQGGQHGVQQSVRQSVQPGARSVEAEGSPMGSTVGAHSAADVGAHGAPVTQNPDALFQDPDAPLTAEHIRALSAETGRLLALAGASGWGIVPGGPVPLVPRVSVVDRLEMYRFLLQR